MNPEQALEALLDDTPRAEVEVEVVRSQDPPAPVQNHWEQHGFLSDIATVCENLEGEQEQFLFDAETRQLIETISNAQHVEDFDRYTTDDLHNFIRTLRHRVPQIEQQVVTFINQLTRARAVQVESVDFI